MSNMNFPFSGNVPITQAINPWELWIKSFSSQLGFININNISSSDQNIEQEVVEEVAGYGKQLGRINDVLTTLIENPGLENLSESEKHTVTEFKDMVSEINAVKEKWKSPARMMAALDNVVDHLNVLKRDDRDLYDQAIARLADGLGLNQFAKNT